jgi:hypothetical protein
MVLEEDDYRITTTSTETTTTIKFEMNLRRRRRLGIFLHEELKAEDWLPQSSRGSSGLDRADTKDLKAGFRGLVADREEQESGSKLEHDLLLFFVCLKCLARKSDSGIVSKTAMSRFGAARGPSKHITSHQQSETI